MNPVPVIPKDDQPDWMRRAMRGTDWGVLLALLIGLAAAWPFVTASTLPSGTGSERAVYQTWEIAESLREGQLYPRWSAYSAGGYGAPIPNFRPPVASYLPALIHVLLTDDPILAVRVVFVLSFCIASIGMYSFIMKRLNAGAGLIAATLYILSPYVGLTVPHAWGDLQTMVALALLPSALWAIVRLGKHNAPLDMALVTFLSALLLLTDPRYALIEIVLAVPLVLTFSAKSIFNLLIAWFISIIVGTIYWMPAVVEANLVDWLAQPATIQLPSIQLASLVAPISPLDPILANLQPQVTLGWAILMTNGLGLGAWYLRRRFVSLSFAYLLIGISLTATALIFGSDTIWLMGPITFCFAISGTSFIFWREQFAARYGRLINGMMLVFILLFSSQVFFVPSPSGVIEQPSPQAIMRFEQLGYGYATVMPWEPVPIPKSAIQHLRSTTTLNDDLIRFGSYRRTQSLATLIHNGTHEQTYQIRPTSAQTITLNLNYYPGWQAYVDRQLVKLDEDPDTGFMFLSLPTLRGPGELHISLSMTAIQRVSTAISFAGLVLLALFVRRRQQNKTTSPYVEDRLLVIEDARLLAASLLLALAIIALSDANESSPLRAQPASSLIGTTLLRNRSDIGLEAYTLKLSQITVTPDDTLNATIHWRTSVRLQDNFYRYLVLRDVFSGSIHWQSSLDMVSHIPSRRWLRDQLYVDDITITLPDDIEPGRYTLSVIVENCREYTGDDITCDRTSPLTFFDRVGNELGRQLTLAQVITVVPE